MNQLLFDTANRYLTISPDDPSRPLRVTLKQGDRRLNVVIGGTSIQVSFDETGSDAPAITSRFRNERRDPNPRYRIALCQRPDNGFEILVEQRGRILASFDCRFDPAQVGVETENATVVDAAWDDLKVAGRVAAPRGMRVGAQAGLTNSRNLMLFFAPVSFARQLSGVAQDFFREETDTIILNPDLTGGTVEHGNGTADAILRTLIAERGAVGALEAPIQQSYDEIIVVVVNNAQLPDVDQTLDVIQACPDNGTLLFRGGHVQKLWARDFARLDLGEEPFALSGDPTEQSRIDFAADALPSDAPQSLRDAFARVKESIADAIEDAAIEGGVRRDLNAAFRSFDTFWTLENCDMSSGNAFGFGWMLETLFGFGTLPQSESVEALRRTFDACARQRIATLCVRLGPADSPVFYLIDRRLLKLARDATFARGLRPLDDYFTALDRDRSATLRVEHNGISIVFLYFDDGVTSELAPRFLQQAATAMDSLASASGQADHARLQDMFAQEQLDLSFTVSALNALGKFGQQRFDDPRIVRFLSSHHPLVPAIATYALNKAGPNAVAGVMNGLDQLGPDLSDTAALAVAEATIRSRMYPESPKSLRRGLSQLDYGLRRWAAMQCLEKSRADYRVDPNGDLSALALDEVDRNFSRFLAHLKGGDLAETLDFGRKVVETNSLRPEHRLDVLATAFFAGDADKAAAIRGLIGEDLAPPDELYFDAWTAVLDGDVPEVVRQDVTRRILDLEPDFADLKVTGRKYRQLHDFDTRPDPERDVICVITAKNEVARIGEVMDHHAKLGVTHFIVIDNMSSDGTIELARKYGAKVIQTSESYRQSRYGMAWVNDVLDRYCTGFWTLVIDADEMLVYPGMDFVPLRDFAARLDALGYEGMGTVLIDMYPDGPISALSSIPRGALRDTYCNFDAGNFTFWPRLRSPTLGISGGLRDRMFRIGRFAPLAPIAHNKTPLVKWKRGMKYLTSTHDITPIRTPPCFAVLEHFKYTPDFVLRAKREVLRKEHWDGGSEYAAYASVLETEPDVSFVDRQFSRRRAGVMEQIAAVSPFPWPSDLVPDPGDWQA